MNQSKLSISSGVRSAYPVVFGPADRQLFGWYHPPQCHGGQFRDCVVVMCNPLGWESFSSQRLYRTLAEHLAASGFAVLRYDHYATGDSSGQDDDRGQLVGWMADVGTAALFGKCHSGASRASLFGVRMGATLALAAAYQPARVDSVVVWAPFLSGSQFLRDIRSAARRSVGSEAAAAPSAMDDGSLESRGYWVSAETVAELERLNLLAADVEPPPRVLLLKRDDVIESDQLAWHLGGTGCNVTPMRVPGYARMLKDAFEAVMPLQAFAQIVSWLELRYPLDAVPEFAEPAEPPRLSAFVGNTGVCVSETPAFFGHDRRLFGIVSTPASAPTPHGKTGAIFVNVGSVHHVGPNRAYVNQARALAAQGFVSLRIDVGGVGESPSRDPDAANRLYDLQSVADISDAISWLRQQHELDSIVLIGIGSGGYLSYRASIHDSHVTGLVLINPQTVSWTVKDPQQQKSKQQRRSLHFYRSPIARIHTWRRLAKRQIRAGIIRAGIAATLRKRLVTQLTAEPAKAPMPMTTVDVTRRIRRLQRQSMTTLLIYGSGNAGLGGAEGSACQDTSTAGDGHYFEIQTVDGADQAFTPVKAQHRLLELVTLHLVTNFGQPLIEPAAAMADEPPTSAAETAYEGSIRFGVPAVADRRKSPLELGTAPDHESDADAYDGAIHPGLMRYRTDWRHLLTTA